MKSQPNKTPGEPAEAVASTGNQEALAWLVGLSDTLLLRLIGGQLPLPEVPHRIEEVC